jgi:hypothetical protein
MAATPVRRRVDEAAISVVTAPAFSQRVDIGTARDPRWACNARRVQRPLEDDLAPDTHFRGFVGGDRVRRREDPWAL